MSFMPREGRLSRSRMSSVPFGDNSMISESGEAWVKKIGVLEE